MVWLNAKSRNSSKFGTKWRKLQQQKVLKQSAHTKTSRRKKNNEKLYKKLSNDSSFSFTFFVFGIRAEIAFFILSNWIKIKLILLLYFLQKKKKTFSIKANEIKFSGNWGKRIKNPPRKKKYDKFTGKKIIVVQEEQELYVCVLHKNKTNFTRNGRSLITGIVRNSIDFCKCKQFFFLYRLPVQLYHIFFLHLWVRTVEGRKKRNFLLCNSLKSTTRFVLI